MFDVIAQKLIEIAQSSTELHDFVSPNQNYKDNLQTTVPANSLSRITTRFTRR